MTRHETAGWLVAFALGVVIGLRLRTKRQSRAATG